MFNQIGTISFSKWLLQFVKFFAVNILVILSSLYEFIMTVYKFVSLVILQVDNIEEIVLLERFD